MFLTEMNDIWSHVAKQYATFVYHKLSQSANELFCFRLDWFYPLNIFPISTELNLMMFFLLKDFFFKILEVLNQFKDLLDGALHPRVRIA